MQKKLTKCMLSSIINYGNIKTKDKLCIKIIERGVKKMQDAQGKHFSITDPKDVNTVIYRINETEKEFLNALFSPCPTNDDTTKEAIVKPVSNKSLILYIHNLGLRKW